MQRNSMRMPIALIIAVVMLTGPGKGVLLAACDIGTITFQGAVSFAAPIPGISLTDLTVSIKPTSEGTGDKCLLANLTTDVPDGMTGAFSVSAQVTLQKGGGSCSGGSDPDGSCLITLQVTGSDPGPPAVAARGSRVSIATELDIESSVTLSNQDITVRQAKAAAGLPVSSECFKWAKKQMRKRVVCNAHLLKGGSADADKCKDGCTAMSTNPTPPCEPPACDDGNFVEAVLAFAHDSNDQQTNPPAATAVSDFTDPVIRNGVICQKKFGKSAVNYVAKRTKLIQKLCVETATDSESCRATQSADSASKFNPIDSAPCVAGQITDGGTGKILPDVKDPCSATCITGSGPNSIDRKCMKACLQQVMDEYSDGLIGEIGQCGDGIVQSGRGEFCDDGDTDNLDCCTNTCTVQAAGTEGPNGNPTCSDGGDNDCDDLIDGADPDCL